MKFGQLFLRKITEVVATRCHILRLNALNSISAGLLPRPRWGSLQRSPRLDPQADAVSRIRRRIFVRRKSAEKKSASRIRDTLPTRQVFFT